jgi:hypothetical protein
MELWEGAILIIGGVWLVGYMTQKNAANQATLAQANSGISNGSNLTTITNQSGGYPTYAGEPLEAPQPPLLTMRPVGTPVRAVGSPPAPAGSLAIRGGPATPLIGTTRVPIGGPTQPNIFMSPRPMQVHL